MDSRRCENMINHLYNDRKSIVDSVDLERNLIQNSRK